MLPTKEQLLEFVRSADGKAGSREIARAFDVRGAERDRLYDMLRELRNDGELDPERRADLPPVAVIEITGIDRDGEPVARVASKKDVAIHFAADDRGPAPSVGDRLLVRLSRTPDGSYAARTIKRLERAPRDILGVLEIVDGRRRIIPTDRRIKTGRPIVRDSDVSPGSLVVARTGRDGHAQIVETVGERAQPSAIALHARGIPTEFSREALVDASKAEPVPPENRTDLRQVPLVTIDGEDARDFDDAVWAEPSSGGGWHLLVAIADVAWYVRPDSPLDQCARERGNSVYFPDRVVPMLPKELSDGLCSLVPGENRGCLAVHLWIDADGNPLRHEFVRGIMRSARRLTYEEVEDARRGAGPLADIVAPLYGAFEALLAARKRRGAIDLDLPERRVLLDSDGDIATIASAARLDSHRLVEEFMIAANVAAAQTLERAPCMYRVHDRPPAGKIEELRETLHQIGIRLGRSPSSGNLQRVIERVAAMPEADMINLSVLRAQAQAEYAPGNIGHFGLALGRYAHFTSPIRRYADLLVHRSLIATAGLGEGGLRSEDGAAFAELGRHLSMTERRAAEAEREALDRYAALHLADRAGTEFAARIAGINRAGLFVTLDETGANGFVPMSALGDERFDFDRLRLTGRVSGIVHAIGDPVTARLDEANVHTGSLIFSIRGGGSGPRTDVRGTHRRGPKRAAARKNLRRRKNGGRRVQ